VPDAPSLPATAAVAGAGAMGAGIAARLTLAGLPTTLVVRRAEAVDAAVLAARARLANLVRLGATSQRAADAAAARLTAALGWDGVRVDLVVETVAESLDDKLEVLPQAEQALAEDGLLVTNTSSLPLVELAAPLTRPERFAGWHWFHPAELVQVVEVVGAPATAPEVLQRLVALTEALGKTPVVVARPVPGFVANRLQYALLREAWALVEAGVCSPADVDRAVVEGLGARWAAIGPFQTVDLAGLDVHEAVAQELYPQLACDTEPPAALRTIRAEGALGVKGGLGVLGPYDPDQARAITERRDRTLVALQRLRDAT
jgi:3-hydroxybutyryl-CoA dehydrogenase